MLGLGSFDSIFLDVYPHKISTHSVKGLLRNLGFFLKKGLRLVYTLFSCVLRDSTPRFVSPSVLQSVTLYFFGFFFAVFGLTAPAQMIK